MLKFAYSFFLLFGWERTRPKDTEGAENCVYLSQLSVDQLWDLTDRRLPIPKTEPPENSDEKCIYPAKLSDRKLGALIGDEIGLRARRGDLELQTEEENDEAQQDVEAPNDDFITEATNEYTAEPTEVEVNGLPFMRKLLPLQLGYQFHYCADKRYTIVESFNDYSVLEFIAFFALRNSKKRPRFILYRGLKTLGRFDSMEKANKELQTYTRT